MLPSAACLPYATFISSCSLYNASQENEDGASLPEQLQQLREEVQGGCLVRASACRVAALVDATGLESLTTCREWATAVLSRLDAWKKAQTEDHMLWGVVQNVLGKLLDEDLELQRARRLEDLCSLSRACFLEPAMEVLRKDFVALLVDLGERQVLLQSGACVEAFLKFYALVMRFEPELRTKKQDNEDVELSAVRSACVDLDAWLTTMKEELARKLSRWCVPTKECSDSKLLRLMQQGDLKWDTSLLRHEILKTQPTPATEAVIAQEVAETQQMLSEVLRMQLSLLGEVQRFVCVYRRRCDLDVAGHVTIKAWSGVHEAKPTLTLNVKALPTLNMCSLQLGCIYKNAQGQQCLVTAQPRIFNASRKLGDDKEQIVDVQFPSESLRHLEKGSLRFSACLQEETPLLPGASDATTSAGSTVASRCCLLKGAHGSSRFTIKKQKVQPKRDRAPTSEAEAPAPAAPPPVVSSVSLPRPPRGAVHAAPDAASVQAPVALRPTRRHVELRRRTPPSTVRERTRSPPPLSYFRQSDLPKPTQASPYRRRRTRHS